MQAGRAGPGRLGTLILEPLPQKTRLYTETPYIPYLHCPEATKFAYPYFSRPYILSVFATKIFLFKYYWPMPPISSSLIVYINNAVFSSSTSVTVFHQVPNGVPSYVLRPIADEGNCNIPSPEVASSYPTSPDTRLLHSKCGFPVHSNPQNYRHCPYYPVSYRPRNEFQDAIDMIAVEVQTAFWGGGQAAVH